MAIWKILLITLLSTVVLGCIAGVLIGKHQLKKERGEYKPLLTRRERIICLSSVVLGAALILLGIFQPFPRGGGGDDFDGMTEGGEMAVYGEMVGEELAMDDEGGESQEEAAGDGQEDLLDEESAGEAALDADSDLEGAADSEEDADDQLDGSEADDDDSEGEEGASTRSASTSGGTARARSGSATATAEVEVAVRVG